MREVVEPQDALLIPVGGSLSGHGESGNPSSITVDRGRARDQFVMLSNIRSSCIRSSHLLSWIMKGL
jgi:hypothetical protein